jgi:hypothetical protein
MPFNFWIARQADRRRVMRNDAFAPIRAVCGIKSFRQGTTVQSQFWRGPADSPGGAEAAVRFGL